MKGRLTAVSLGLTAAAAVFVLVWPAYSGSGPSRSLLEVNGPSALIPVMFPVFVAMVALVFRKQAV